MDHDNFSQPRAAGAATYASKPGNAVKFYNDASEDPEGNKGAFADIIEAMRQAKHFIFISDWSFHPGMKLTRTGIADRVLGQLLLGCAGNGVMVAIHTWRHNPAAADNLNDVGLQTLQDMEKKRWTAGEVIGKRLLWRASRRTGVGYSHHQKFVVLDAPVDPNDEDGPRVIKAFFGGLDLTAGRFDWPDHILPGPTDQRGYFRPDDWYNGEFANNAQAPREPWHDIHAQIIGPTAWDFIHEFVGRWSQSPNGSMPLGHDGEDAVSPVWGLYSLLKDTHSSEKIYQANEAIPASIEQTHGMPIIWSGQVIRSIKKEHWGAPQTYQLGAEANPLAWTLQPDYEASIEQTYIDAIGRAEDYIYIESQYFIGSGYEWGQNSVKNRVPEALVRRILNKAAQKHPFHVYVVLPMFPEGDPTSEGILGVRALQWRTIGWMVKTLHARLGTQWGDYLSFYFLGQWSHVPQMYDPQQVKTRSQRLAASGRYMVYVHSKLMIVDDQCMILGSANLNERSLAGDRDTEICVYLQPDPNRTAPAKVQGGRFRYRLWREHLGPGWEASLEKPALMQAMLAPGSLECVTMVQETATRNYRRFLSGQRDGQEGHLMMWPIILEKGELTFSNLGFNDNRTSLIPDYMAGGEKNFYWIPQAGSLLNNLASSYLIE